jgi:hypothetical protein
MHPFSKIFVEQNFTPMTFERIQLLASGRYTQSCGIHSSGIKCFLVVGARAIFFIKLTTKIFIIAHTSERMGVLQVKKDITLELLWEKCEISMVIAGRNFSGL